MNRRTRFILFFRSLPDQIKDALPWVSRKELISLAKAKAGEMSYLRQQHAKEIEQVRQRIDEHVRKYMDLEIGRDEIMNLYYVKVCLSAEEVFCVTDGDRYEHRRIAESVCRQIEAELCSVKFLNPRYIRRPNVGVPNYRPGRPIRGFDFRDPNGTYKE